MKLSRAVIPVIIVGDVDNEYIHQLDQLIDDIVQYTNIVPESAIGMKGFDYRENILPSTPRIL
jgi:hypothetical protein